MPTRLIHGAFAMALIAMPFTTACDEKDGGGGQDTYEDAMEDMTDVQDDSAMDTVADPPADTEMDAEEDMPGDMVEDMMEEDAPGDVAMDMEDDELLSLDSVEEPLPMNIEDLRSVADGWIDPKILLEEVYLTYVVPYIPPSAEGPISHPGNGFYVQEDASGPAIFVSTGDTDASTLVSQGDVVSLVVDQTDTFHGVKRVTAFEDLTVVSSGHDITPMIQDITSDGVVDESRESELVRITGATLGEGTGEIFPLSYGTSASTDLAFMQDLAGVSPCPGMTLDLVGIASEYDGAYRIMTFRDSDLSGVDSGDCP